MKTSTGPEPYKILLVSLIVVLALLYGLQYQQHSEHIMRQNYLLDQKMDSLTSIVSGLQERLHWAERNNNVSQYRLPDRLLFCGDTLDLNDPLLREKVEREFYSLLSKQGQIHLYLKRSLRYVPMIREKLAAENLPPDIKYLAVHESALLPRIRSRSNAVGLWQFMRSTGRLYRLKINNYIDERQDPEKSTDAAIRMLKDLYRKFGDWQLVMAAYNGGLNRIQRNINKQKTSEFLALSLPEETERYYFKILATKLILEDPETYGFIIDEDDYFYTPRTRAVQFSIHANQMSLGEIAEISGMDLPYFKHLNPQFTNSYLPRGTYNLYIPESTYAHFVKKAESYAHFNYRVEEGAAVAEVAD